MSTHEEEEKLRHLLVRSGVDGSLGLGTVTQMKLVNQQLIAIPNALWGLVALKELDLGNNHLEVLPEALGQLSQLTLLNLMSNRLTHLPRSIGALKELRILGLKSNHLVELPDEIGDLANLHSLFLTDNRLRTLPASIGRLTSLRKLQAAQNELADLPDTVSALQSLELFRMPSNLLQALPSSLFLSPKLCWFSISANPLCPPPPSPVQPLPVIALSDVDLTTTLGAGASGTVYKTLWREQQVAVKLFKSDVSPDGPCTEEIRVVCALQHASIPRVYALLQANKGLVMSLINAKALADRPDSSRLLRSRYAPQLRFGAAGGKSVVHCIASALQYLHSLGVSHGDVYAHNVLLGSGAVPLAWLCDFGAAFAYTRSGSTLAFELLEVRAFGILLEEIRQRTELNEQQLARWTSIEERILTKEVHRRPTFTVIVAQIADLV